MKRVGFYQRAGENVAHVASAPARGFMKFHLQRRVEQHGFPVDLTSMYVWLSTHATVFCDNKQRFWCNRLAYSIILYIKPRRVYILRVGQPSQWVCSMTQRAPIFNLFRNRVIAKSPIQIVEITHLIINLIVPAIAGIVIDDLKMQSSSSSR